MAAGAVEARVLLADTEQLFATVDAALVEAADRAFVAAGLAQPIEREAERHDNHGHERPAEEAVEARAFEHVVVRGQLAVRRVEEAVDDVGRGAPVLENEVTEPQQEGNNQHDERDGTLCRFRG